MNKIVLVFLETFKRQVKSWSFLIMVLAPFLAIGLGFLLGKVSSDNAEDMVKDVTEIAVVATSKDLQKQFENQTNVTIRYESLDKAKKALNKDKIAGYVRVSLKKGRYEASYYGKGSIDETSKAGIMNVLSRLQSSQNIVAAQLNDDQLHKLQVQPNFVEIKNSASKQNQIDKKQQEKFANKTAYMILLFVMYFILITYSTTTAQEIGSEKGTKIMEVLFSSMPARNYFYGKMLGLTMVIVLHISIYAIGGGVIYALAPRLWGDEALFKTAYEMINIIFKHLISINLVYVLLMIILCTVLAALCGALVVRIEDSNKAVQPVMYLIIAGFIASMAFQGKPESVIVVALSYIPGVSAFFMPLRIINGTVGTIGIGVSLTLFLATVILAIVWCARVYPGLILQTDDEPLLKNLKKALNN